MPKEMTNVEYFFARYGYCFAIIPPLLVLGLGGLLFAMSAPSFLSEVTVAFKSMIDATHEHDLTVHFAEVRARYIWLSTVCFNLVVPIYAISVCAIIIYQVPLRHQFVTITTIGVFLIILGLSALAFEIKSEGVVYRLIFGFTYFNLKNSGHFDLNFINHVRITISSLNILSFVAPVFVVLAASSILASHENREQVAAPFRIATQMHQLKSVINVGSALLVSGVIHTNAWLQWTISLVPEPHMREAFSEVAMAIVVFWGTTFTLLLLMIAAPATSYLSKKAQALAQQEFQAGRVSDPKEWLQNHGLSHALGEQLPQVIAVLAPLLAGPVGSVLTSTIR